MSSSSAARSLLARRLLVATTTRRAANNIITKSRLVAATMTAPRPYYFSTASANKINETLANKPDTIINNNNNDTHMHDEFRVLEDMLENNWHDVDDATLEQLKLLSIRKGAAKPIAVDAPDGETDGHLQEELNEVKAILDDVAAHKKEIRARLERVAAAVADARKVYAVDSPDGETDGHIAEELQEINHIIDDAAAHEEKETIEYQHKMDDAVRKERARDPEHDW